MSDTATNPAKRGQKPRDVDYTLEIVDGDLPDMEQIRRSPLEDQLDKIVATEAAHQKWVRIGSYANGSASSAAANVLRQRHGNSAKVQGWEIRSKRIDTDGEPRTGLFAKYDPSKIVDGAQAEWDATEQARKAKINARREETKANGGSAAGEKTPREDAGGPQGTSGTAAAAGAKAPGAKK